MLSGYANTPHHFFSSLTAYDWLCSQTDIGHIEEVYVVYPAYIDPEGMPLKDNPGGFPGLKRDLKGARQIIGRSQRQNPQRQAGA